MPIKSRNLSHDQYEVVERDVVLGIISIRGGSERDKGRDYIPGDLNISPQQAKDLAQCPWKREDFIACMEVKGIFPPAEQGEEEAGEMNGDE